MKPILPKFMALWMVLLLAPASRAGMGFPIIQSYMPSDLGGGRSWTMVQGPDGVFYFGCDALVTFDGEHWAKHPVPGSYTVRGIAPTTDRVWVGAVNEIGYFDRGPAGLSNYHSLLSYLPADQRNIGDVWEVQTQGNEVVFASSSAIYVWNGSKLKVLPEPGSRRLMALSAGGKILIVSRQTGVCSLEQDELRPFIPTSQFGSIVFRWIGRDGPYCVLATDQGLMRYDGRNLTPYGQAATEFLRHHIVTSGCLTRDGEMIVGTLEGGVAVFRRDGSIRRIITKEDGLPSNDVTAVLIGRDGALWAGSPVGVVRLALDEGCSLFDDRLGLNSRNVESLGFSGTELIAATTDGVYAMPAGTGRGVFHPLPDLTSSYAALAAAPGATLLVGGFKRVLTLDGETPRIFLAVKSVVDVALQSTRTPGTVFIGNDADVVQAEARNGQAATIVGSVHLPDAPQSIAEDGTGHLWLGTETRGVFTFAEPLPKESADTAAPEQPAASGPARVARIGAQVAVFRSSGIELYRSPEGAPQLVANAPTTDPTAVSNADGDETLWAVYESPFSDQPRVPMLGRLHTQDKGPPSWTTYAASGLGRLGRINTLNLGADGMLWIGGMNGILRIDPATLQQAGAPEAPLLTATVLPGARLPAQQNTVQFEFSALEFGRRESLRYQTRLARDARWSPPSNESQQTLVGLRDGRYSFEVRTVGDTGLTSAAAVWKFTVLPPWYRTIPAMAGFLALAGAGVYGGFRWRLAYLRQQNARLESLVQKKTEQLEKANEAKSEFLANMSHEIRNPISGILGLSLAFEETPLTPRQRQLAESINSCASLLATLVDDVLDFSKIEAGTVDLRCAPFTLSVLFEQAVSMVAIDAREADSAIQVTIDPQLPEQLMGDAGRLQQILLNYLTNALKFGRGKAIEVGASCGLHDRVRFFVRDYGTGMTPAESATLFAKFSRLESARAKNIRGTGLGLAVCRLIATRMGGRVGVDSWPGAGSCFWAEIPLGRAVTPPAVPDEVAAAVPLRALVVEDIDYNIVAMQAILRRLGLSSDVVIDGPSALQRLQQSFYDVAFLDWNLPGMNGNEVAYRFRATEPPGRRTFLIATTAHSSELTRESCLQAGMDAFIAKPVTPAKIAEALRELGAVLRAARKVETRLEPELAPGGELDLEMLRFLAAEAPGGLAEQVQRFLAAFDADRRLAREAVASGDTDEMRRTAHRLLSHCSMVKYAPLSQLASDLQRIAAFAPPADLERLLTQFDQEFAALRCKLESSLASTAPG